MEKFNELKELKPSLVNPITLYRIKEKHPCNSSLRKISIIGIVGNDINFIRQDGRALL